MRRVEIDDVEEMLEKIVTKDGKVGGLMKHAGKKVLIVVQKEKKWDIGTVVMSGSYDEDGNTKQEWILSIGSLLYNKRWL